MEHSGVLNPNLHLTATPLSPASCSSLPPLLCCFRWEQVVDLTYSLRLGAKPRPMEQDEAAVEKLRYELCPGFCYSGGQAAFSLWLPRQPSPADLGERGEDRQLCTAQSCPRYACKKQEIEQDK